MQSRTSACVSRVLAGSSTAVSAVFAQKPNTQAVSHVSEPECKLASMERRDFLIGSAAVVGRALLARRSAAQETEISDRTYRILGVPLRSGSLYPGNENDARAYRDAHLFDRLHAAECKAFDEGDVAIPSYLPHHSIPPIRNWPGPRIAWECVSE